jgi:uncharacterized protein YjbI with pentapeptide repeats
VTDSTPSEGRPLLPLIELYMLWPIGELGADQEEAMNGDRFVERWRSANAQDVRARLLAILPSDRPWAPLVRALPHSEEVSNGADLRGIDLRGVRLAGADLAACALDYADLRETDLQGALLSASSLTGARLDGANLTRAMLTGATMDGATFVSANLTSADLTTCHVERADFRDAVFHGAHLFDCQFVKCNMRGASLRGVRVARSSNGSRHRLERRGHGAMQFGCASLIRTELTKRAIRTGHRLQARLIESHAQEDESGAP